MSREYEVVFEKISVTAVQDLVAATGAAGMLCKVKRFNIDCVDTTSPTDQQLALRLRLLPATVTAGSGGASATPQKTEGGDPAATFTARVNDTTKATTSGTARTFWEGGCNIKAGIEKFGNKSWMFGPSQAAVLELITAPNGAVAITLSGSMTIEEIGG